MPNQCEPWQLNLTHKAQYVRLADVFLIGPLMVAGGVALKARGNVGWGLLLGVLGIGTVIFNGIGFLKIQEALKK